METEQTVRPKPAASLRLERVRVAPTVGLRDWLRDVSFEVKPGDRLALVGPSGAGKTLLLRLMARLTEPSGGAIFWGDRPLGEIPVRQWRQAALFVHSEPKLLGATAAQALAYPLMLRGFDPLHVRERLERWRDRLQISPQWLELHEWQLTKVQRQWISLARATIAEPSLLLLDEPTASLDGPAMEHWLGVWGQLSQGGRAVAIADRNLDFARRFATRVLYLQDGELLENLSADRIDWAQLQQTLARAETEFEL